jgi:ComF family protein
MRMIFHDIANLFFPKLCVLCRDPLIQDEEQICLQCLCDLPQTNFFRQDDNPVTGLFAGKVEIAHAAAFLHYEKGGKVQKLVHTFKYHGNKQLAYQLGKLFALSIPPDASYLSADFLIPVPLHPRRKWKRGYNQSEWICRGMASVWHIPILTSALQRRTKTNTQTNKNIYERWLNMQEVFVLRNTEALQGGCHALLIDDVVTSGSTLAACAEVLLSIPDIKLSILTIATV